METHREHPQYFLDTETLLVATYVWDDELKAFQAFASQDPRRDK